jgi:hypothetical protein
MRLPQFLDDLLWRHSRTYRRRCSLKRMQIDPPCELCSRTVGVALLRNGAFICSACSAELNAMVGETR